MTEQDHKARNELARCVVEYAIKKAKKAPVWAVVAEITTWGSRHSAQLCAEFMPKLGWKDTLVETPLEGRTVLACEDLGDEIHKFSYRADGWYRGPTRVFYTPGWWREL